jgi:hypothetical protein
MLPNCASTLRPKFSNVLLPPCDVSAINPPQSALTVSASGSPPVNLANPRVSPLVLLPGKSEAAQNPALAASHRMKWRRFNRLPHRHLDATT